jgi:hypothetical protein
MASGEHECERRPSRRVCAMGPHSIDHHATRAEGRGTLAPRRVPEVLQRAVAARTDGGRDSPRRARRRRARARECACARVCCGCASAHCLVRTQVSTLLVGVPLTFFEHHYGGAWGARYALDVGLAGLLYLAATLLWWGTNAGLLARGILPGLAWAAQPLAVACWYTYGAAPALCSGGEDDVCHAQHRHISLIEHLFWMLRWLPLPSFAFGYAVSWLSFGIGVQLDRVAAPLPVRVLLVHAANACAAVVFKHAGGRLGGVIAAHVLASSQAFESRLVVGLAVVVVVAAFSVLYLYHTAFGMLLSRSPVLKSGFRAGKGVADVWGSRELVFEGVAEELRAVWRAHTRRCEGDRERGRRGRTWAAGVSTALQALGILRKGLRESDGLFDALRVRVRRFTRACHYTCIVPPGNRADGQVFSGRQRRKLFDGGAQTWRHGACPATLGAEGRIRLHSAILDAGRRSVVGEQQLLL